MVSLVLTVIGDDRTGLVGALAEVVAEHGGNWERSHMAELAGKFAGIVLVRVGDGQVDALISGLEPLKADGLLDIAVERASAGADTPGVQRVVLELVGQDHPGIVSQISNALAGQGISIDELTTETEDAAMSGGKLFKATAELEVPADCDLVGVQDLLEDLANELMVDVNLAPEGPVS